LIGPAGLSLFRLNEASTRVVPTRVCERSCLQSIHIRKAKLPGLRTLYAGSSRPCRSGQPANVVSPASSNRTHCCWTVAHAKNQVTEGVNLKQSMNPASTPCYSARRGDLGTVYAELGVLKSRVHWRGRHRQSRGDYPCWQTVVGFTRAATACNCLWKSTIRASVDGDIKELSLAGGLRSSTAS